MDMPPDNPVPSPSRFGTGSMSSGSSGPQCQLPDFVRYQTKGVFWINWKTELWAP